MTGTNLLRFHHLGALLNSLRVPWIVAGDYNMPAPVLSHSGFLTAVGGQVVQASVETTCSTGETGSHIDYLVCSQSARALI
eukprot:9469218-Pyramimonas_sp.AAC.1